MRFDLDNPILLVLNRVFNAAVTTMLWILCCLPVVTVGAATAAMYATMMAIAADDCDGVLSKFFASFRENWKTATLLWITFIPLAAILAVEAGSLFSTEPSGGMVSVVMKGLVVVGVAVFGALWVYSFSGAARLVVTYRQCLSNSLLLALGNPWQTAGILAAAVAMITCVVFAPTWSLLVWIIGVYVQCWLLNKVYSRVIQNWEGGSGD